MNSHLDPDRQPMYWVGDWAGRRRALTPDRLAVIEPHTGTRLDYRALDDRVCRLAGWMQAVAGIRAGDRVGLVTTNRLEAIELYLACGKLGAVLAPISHRLTADEASQLLARLRPSWLFYDTTLREFVAALHGTATQCPQFSFGGPQSDYDRVLPGYPANAVNTEVALADPALIVHTGGSTGLPKLCVISHRQMVWNAFELLSAAPDGLGRRRELVLFPLFHIGGWNTVTPILHAGGCLVLQPAFDAAEALQLIETHAVNHFGAVEAMLKAMTQAPAFASSDLASLEGITTAGAPCAPATMAPFFRRGIPVSQSYGLTEAGPSNFLQPRADQSLETLEARQQSIGTSLFHCDYRIVDPKTETETAPGVPGELQLRSQHTFDGYLDDADATQQRVRPDGWVRSGDLAVTEENGQVRVIGRLDHVIITGGENVAAEEVEAALVAHEAVQSALVFGIPDERWGERPVAWVTGPEESEIPAVMASLDDKLSRFKQPVAIELVDTLPLTGAGKPDRRSAQAHYLSKHHGDPT
ncbi:AMP-dependent synthetase and ligase [Spiribacter salinus M19-40]|uniref:AMP-dependent synthetase and ligase n=1 Tax=Spiribacter salinus M19-40 TaxID=1260251 RepID=R4V4R8_9GAMM|nr:AMP-binding protein [Spiribacter salinus]AGM40944.1 AMP-dependent synthetase and ligase [Spiribacter salinus M19-40]